MDWIGSVVPWIDFDQWYLGLDDFGGKVLWCPTQCPSAVGDLLRKTKVGDLKVLYFKCFFVRIFLVETYI